MRRIVPMSDADKSAAAKAAYLRYISNIRKSKLGYAPCDPTVWLGAALEDENIDIQSFVSLCVYAYAD